MRGQAVRAVHTLFAERAVGVVMIDPAAVGLVVHAGMQRQPVGHDRQIERGAVGKVGPAVVCARRIGDQRHAKGIGIGGRGDIADRAAFGTVAIERALRPAQHLDPFDIGQAHFDRSVAIEIGHGDRHIVEIQPDRRCARHRTDPADDDIGAAFFARNRVECHARHRARQIVIIGDLLILQRSTRQH